MKINPFIKHQFKMKSKKKKISKLIVFLKRPSKESDIWSVGLILIYLLTKKTYLSEIQDFEKNDNRFRSIEDNITSRNHKFSDLYISLIKKCLCEDPKERVDSGYLLDQLRLIYRKIRSKGAVHHSDPHKSIPRNSTKKDSVVKGRRRRSGSFMKISTSFSSTNSSQNDIDDLPRHLNSVKSWLNSNDFGDFEEKFKALGYDDLIIFPELSDEEILEVGISNEKLTDFRNTLKYLKKETTWYLEKETKVTSIDDWLDSLSFEIYKESLNSFESIETMMEFIKNSSIVEFESIGISLPGHIKKLKSNLKHLQIN